MHTWNSSIEQWFRIFILHFSKVAFQEVLQLWLLAAYLDKVYAHMKYTHSNVISYFVLYVIKFAFQAVLEYSLLVAYLGKVDAHMT